eukprot:scaffold89267_cov63-Phaeocystis_antarctica.AAC.3
MAHSAASHSANGVMCAARATKACASAASSASGSIDATGRSERLVIASLSKPLGTAALASGAKMSLPATDGSWPHLAKTAIWSIPRCGSGSEGLNLTGGSLRISGTRHVAQEADMKADAQC